MNSNYTKVFISTEARKFIEDGACSTDQNNIVDGKSLREGYREIKRMGCVLSEWLY